MDLGKVGYDARDRINLAGDTDRWRAYLWLRAVLTTQPERSAKKKKKKKRMMMMINDDDGGGGGGGGGGGTVKCEVDLSASTLVFLSTS
ncbi:hypothetical protein ANN_11307 [Periplaneta americana]|uniref:Uncharacterized protein n=1 Tax=Periplaneta americana TaxID=6978 RepID=A0ABQ8T6C8_PERAM|nr:hypothetical protein ANN_11307 [Periplaneta americana]